MIHARLVSALAIVCSVSMLGAAFAASVRNVYFSNGTVVPGQLYRSMGELPGATKEFTKGTDKVARLFIIVGDLDAHKLGGSLKAADGRIVSRMDRQWSAYSGPINPSWRFTTHAFNLDRLAPGEYQFELFIDDSSKGTYTFTLR